MREFSRGGDEQDLLDKVLEDVFALEIGQTQVGSIDDHEDPSNHSAHDAASHLDGSCNRCLPW